MKLSISKRILMFFHWLFSLLVCAALALFVFAPDLATQCVERIKGSLGHVGAWVVGIVLLAVYLLMAVFQLLAILNRPKREDRGFITVDSSDSGKVRISVSAVEQMVRQSVRNIDGIAEMEIGIDSENDALVITVNAVIQDGCHVPTITMNMQRSIRQFVEVHCGVAVKSVSVSINAVASNPEAGRRGFLGRMKSEPARAKKPEAQANEATGSTVVQGDAAPAAEPEFTYGDSVNPHVEAPQAGEDAESAVEAAASPEPEIPGESAAEPYDFDKPYESDFAKDLAAMRAKAEAGEAPGDE